MIASLPMYDRPETRAANDRFWQGIRAALTRDGIDAPETLTRSGDLHEHWSDPALVLSQTCSLPWRSRYQDTLAVVAAPVHTLDVPPGQYRSVIVMREGENPRDGQRLAINDPLSQSGWAAFAAHWPEYQPSAVLQTGSHAASAQAVAEGKADIAAIDIVTWDMLRQWDHWTDGLAVVEKTAPTPALPYVCPRGADAVRAAMSVAIRELSAEDRATLRLSGLVGVDEESYAALPLPPAPDVNPLQSSTFRA